MNAPHTAPETATPNDIDVTGNGPFWSWFTRVFQKPKSKHQRSNWAYKRDVAHLGWCAAEARHEAELAAARVEIAALALKVGQAESFWSDWRARAETAETVATAARGAAVAWRKVLYGRDAPNAVYNTTPELRDALSRLSCALREADKGREVPLRAPCNREEHAP